MHAAQTCQVRSTGHRPRCVAGLEGSAGSSNVGALGQPSRSEAVRGQPREKGRCSLRAESQEGHQRLGWGKRSSIALAPRMASRKGRDPGSRPLCPTSQLTCRTYLMTSSAPGRSSSRGKGRMVRLLASARESRSLPIFSAERQRRRRPGGRSGGSASVPLPSATGVFSS